MIHFKCYLMSQRLGSVLAEVTLDRHGRGLVELASQDEQQPPVLFSFCQEDIDRLADSPQDWRTLLVQLAVGQAHKYLSKAGHFTTQLEPLDLSSPLWLGDLMAAPYGGATFGVEKRDSWRNTNRARVDE